MPTTPVAARQKRTDEPIAEHQVLGQYIPLLYHYNMLQDEDRVGAFREAIELLIQPGMHVVELGGGTGILSSFAARRGATVSCVERNPELVRHARRFVRQNQLHPQIEVIHADAFDYVPDRPVDAVICEMLHVGLLREKQAQVIAAFKRHYVRKFGPRLPIFLPEVSILMAQPVHQDFCFAGYQATVPMFQAPLLDQPRTTPLAALAPYAHIAYNEPIPMEFAAGCDFTTTAAGSCNAVRLVTQNVIAVDLAGQRAITWPNQCLVLPLENGVDVATGDAMRLEFAYPAGGSIEQLSESLSVVAGKRLETQRSQRAQGKSEA